MDAISNRKISKIIIYFDSMASPNNKIASPVQPPPLREIALKTKRVESKTGITDGSLILAKPIAADDIYNENEKETIIKESSKDNGIRKNLSNTTYMDKIDSDIFGQQNVLLKIKEEPEDNFENENIEDEQSSIADDIADNFLPDIKDEPETIMETSRNRIYVENKEKTNLDKHPDLNEFVNNLIEAKPECNKQSRPRITNRKNLAVKCNSINASTSKSSKCKEFKCNRCTLMQTAFDALACANCRQILEPMWKLGIGICSKSYRCKYENCSKSYARQGDLKIHHRVHTGERPYACSICEKRFSANNNLRRHLKVHTGDKPFTCQRCGKRFMTNSCLKRHVRVHTSSSAILTSFGYENNLLQNP